ncbi:hypothetical protein SLS62_006021 [Diatrype stigma]|uniref:Peptidase S54 rhomboid domain-containing protein n=1 Tax=Diatrype stigma TaxID=117547 RepID=A0AAN9URQ8_9PEZI
MLRPRPLSCGFVRKSLLPSSSPPTSAIHPRIFFSRRRPFGSSSAQSPPPPPPPSYQEYGRPPVRVLGPLLWCLGAASAVYLGCAAYDVRRDAEALKRHLPAGARIASYDDLDAGSRDPFSFWGRRGGHHAPPPPATAPWDPTAMIGLWQSQSDTRKLTIGAIGANAGIYGACRVVPSTWYHFAHAPAWPSNYTLFTSMFGHGGPWHLALNMYALYNFAEPVAVSRTFRRRYPSPDTDADPNPSRRRGVSGSGPHLAAFYLSTGILANLAQHLAGIWPTPAGRAIPALGASGAIMALLGAFGASYPDERVGIVLVPVSFPAGQALAGIALFEAYGLFVGKWMRLGHAAHLAGLALGAAYVHFEGNRVLWEPARRLAFAQMRRLHVV